MNAFHSVVPSSIVDFYDYIGYNRSVGSRADVSYYAIRPLFSVKYLLNRTDGNSFVDDDGDPKMPGFEYKKTTGGYYVYENKNFIPYGFSYDYYMSYDFCDGYSAGSRQHLLLKAMLLTEEQIKKYGNIMTDIQTLQFSGNYGESTTLSFSEDAYEYDCERLAQTAAEDFEIDNEGFTASVYSEKERLFFFSVPYDKGWHAYVNGKEVEIEKVNVGFMAVPVGKGGSKIRFTYTTPGLTNGLAVTAASAAIFLIYFLISYFYVRRRPDSDIYPEGVMLLKQWQEGRYCRGAAGVGGADDRVLRFS